MKFGKKEITEVIGLLAVALSLLFVGQQLRLDRQVALAEQYASRSESMKADLRSRMESDMIMTTLAAAWDRGDRPNWWNSEVEDSTKNAGLSGSEVQMQIFDVQLLYFQDDNLYYQYQQGLLSEEFWDSVENFMQLRIRQNPMVRAIYTNRRIETELDSVIRNIVSELDSE